MSVMMGGVPGQTVLWRMSQRLSASHNEADSGSCHLVVTSTGEIPTSRILRGDVLQVKREEWPMIGGLTPGGLLGKDKVP
jgi:hypothetical protein